tara:strand:- start:2698 stop:15018 length:12321 start_codon:yes stop_codon:yes gene_type:complete
MSSTKGKSNAPWNECIGQMKGQQGVSRRNAQADFLRLNDFLGAKFKGTNYKIGTSTAFQVGNRYGINPDLLKGVKKIPSQYIIASSGQVLDGENTGDIFGWSTDLSEDGLTLAVGSILNDNVNGTNSGSVRVYARSGPEEAWVQKGVDIDGEAAQDYSGWAVTLSADGDRLVVGAVFNDDGGNINTGHVRIYDWNAGTSQWVSVAEFNGGVAGDFFGYSVSLSRDKTRLAVGAPYGLDERGYVSVYDYNGTAWQLNTTINGVLPKSQFGKRVALNDDGSRLVVSAPHALGDTGVVYFYDGSANLLAEKTGPGLGVKFGHALDFRGHTLAVADLTSAPLKIFDMSSDTFITQTAPTGIFRSTEAKVKLSQDGNVLLFSMPAIDTEDNVINSTAVQELNKLGLVKIFARDGDAWKQRGWNMKSYASNNDEFGKSINVSGDGLVVCISAPRKDTFSTDRGCVTAYTVRPISYYVKPTITLLGLNPQPMEANTSYVEAGAVTDTGATVTIVGDIEDNSVEGREYTVRYTAASAFEITTVERTIVITKDPTVPALTLNGDSLMEVPIGGVFNDPGASSNIPASIITDTSGVDFQRVGAYEIKYTAVSTYGISSAMPLTRRIVVVYDFELETVDLVGRTACLSKDGFIAGAADFVQNTVKLYEWNPITPVSWKQIGQTIRNLAINTGQFGATLDLSIDGFTVAVGAPGLSGLVRVYRYDFLVNVWEQKGGDITGVDDGDKIGDFLRISGDGDVVSTGSATPTSTKNPYVFSYRYSATTDSWTKFHEYVEPLKLPSNVASKPFSGSLNSTGSRLLLGAPVNNYTTGAIFLFDLNTDQKLVSIFGDAVGAYLGQSVKLTQTGDTFVYGDVSAACVKVYTNNAATGFWGQMGESITESYSSGGEFGKHVDISSDGTVVTFSDPSTASGQGKICQYAWVALNSTWRVNMVQVKDNITGSFFGRKFYVTEDASKILTESSVSFQYYRWKVARPQFSINGTRILRLSVDQEYDNTGYVSTPAGVTVTVSGVVNSSVTKDYVVKYTMTNDLNISEVAYQIVSVSGGLLQLGLDVTNFDASSTPVNFGRSASMSSDGALIAVGAPGFDGDTGMVKIYQFNSATVHWDLQATVLGPSTGSSFGYSVCLSKNGARLAIGAPGTANGLVRVYASSGGTWNQLGSDLTGTTGGKFGFSVALNLEGSHLTVGEPRRAFDVNTGAGAVRTFEYVTQWTEVSSMVNNQLEHELGHGVAITSTTNVFLAGAPMAGPGYVKLSSYGGGNIPIFAPTMVFGEKFGWSVSISDDGHTFAVGAPYYNNKTGRVLVFDATTSPPSPKGSPILGETPLLEFGFSVHVSGNGQKLMVYAGNGRVSTFQFTNSQWTTNTEEIITSSETNAQFGYALASSGDGRRMLISTPLQDLVQVYSTETTKITNLDFVGATLTLNGPAIFTVGQGGVFTDPGVRRDDGFSEFITTGAVDVNTPGTYNLTYSAVDDSGNPSENTLNRAVTVVDTSQSNNLLATAAVNSSHNNNNACVQVSSDGTRFAVASGAPATTHVSNQYTATHGAPTPTPVHGSVVVYEINESSSPITFAQVDQITDNKSHFATAIQMNQDGTRIAAMHTLDSYSLEISVYEVGNAAHTPFSAPFTGLHGSYSFGLPTHSSIAPITGNAVNLFGRSGDRQSYRYKNLATSSDGTVVAIGKPASDGTDRVSVYRNPGTVAVGALARQGSAISPTGLTSTHSDISSAGERIVFCADETTFIYAAPSNNALPWVKEAEFTATDNVNAVSDDGSVVAFSAKPGGIDFLPIILVGGDRVSISRDGQPWSDPGYTYAGTDSVTVTGTVDTNVSGDYIIQYQTSTNTQIRIVSVGKISEGTFNGSHSATNVPYGPVFAGWTGTWRHYDFNLFTVPAGLGLLSNDDFEMSIILNGNIRMPGNWQYQTIQIFTDGGFSSSINFTSNGSEDSVSYSSWNGSIYYDHTKTTTTAGGSLSSGDVVKGRLSLYNTFYSDFSVDVTVSFQSSATAVRVPSITLTGFSENSILTGEDFVDPGFTSDDPGDALSTYISPTFPQSSSCRKAIVYRAVSSQGIVGYAVRYVEVGERTFVALYQLSNAAWSQFANDIAFPNALDLHDTNIALSESGNRVAISKYVLGQGSIFTYEYSDLTYPPTWVQYGSAIEITKTNRKPGFSLALSGDGNRLVIGSPGDANNAGEAYVYDYGASGWVKKNQDLWSLTTSNFTSLAVTGYSMDLYGHAVDISKDGTHVAVGSPLNVTGQGHVSVYTLSGENFILKGNAIISSTEPEFGRYVSITDTGLDFVTNAGASASSAGRVVQYRYAGNLWYQFVNQTFTVPVANAAISESGNKILSVTDVVEVYVVTESQVPGGQWEQLGIDIDLASITAPGVDTNPSPSSGSRYSPGIFKPTGNTNITGYAVDLSHDGMVLAIGLPFLEIGGGDPFVVNSRGAVAVFNYDGIVWNQVGGTIVPKYVYDNALTSKYDGATSVTVLNEIAEANTFSGAEVSISGDGQYICVGSPGYLSNPIDIQPMDSLPNEGGMTFWTLYRRNESWAPTNDLYNVGWEPVVRRDSELSASLSGYNPQSGSVNEKKRELLGLGLKVSSDGSFVVFDTRTDGVKILTESSGAWSVHGLLDDGVPPKPVPATTDFLVARNMLNPPAVNTTYTQQPSAAVGFGNFPAKYWPVSYISLSTNDKYLSVSNPLLDPLDRATSTNNQQVSDLRLGQVSVFKSSSSTNFTMLGDYIIGDTDAYTWGVDDFAYSHSTISDNGLTMVIPRGVIPSLSDVQEYKKQISIYDFDREADVWGLRLSSVVDGTEVTSSASFPDEYNFMTVLSKDRSTVTSLYLGPTQPVFRQYLVSTTFVQSSYNKVSTLYMASQPVAGGFTPTLNAQPFPGTLDPYSPLLPNERIADFAMSDDGMKIAIGNARDITRFTTINATTTTNLGFDKENGSVSVFTYDTTSEEWGSPVRISVPDTSTYVQGAHAFVSAQFGTRVKFLPDGNTLVVSAPTSRDGLGDIFFFDTSSTTAITQKTIPYANPSTASQGMFGTSLGISDDYTRLFVGDPGHDSGMGRIAVVEYEVSSSSWSGTTQYITRTRAPETHTHTASGTSSSLSTNLMFGRDFDVTRNGEGLISSFLGAHTLANGTLDTTTAGFQDYFTLNSGLEIAEVFKRDAAGVWGLDSSVPARLKALNPGSGILQGTGLKTSLIENTSIRPTVKISGTGLYSMFGFPSLKYVNNGMVERRPTGLKVLINAQNVTPVISLVGDRTINLAYGNPYTDPGVVTDMSFSDRIVISGDQVDINVVGTYVSRYTVTRLGSLTNFVERTFNVFVPADPPTVTLLGSASVSLLINNVYTEPDPPATFTGGVLERYGDPPSGSILGTFTVRYVVRNNLGIASAERVITVEADTTPPVITILGGDVVHKFETTYRDPSYIQSDGNEDVFTTTPAHVLTSRDIGNYLGTTQVTYSATDQSQNVGTTVRNVTVKNEFETTPVQQAGTGHFSTLSSTGNRVAVMDQDAVSIYETGGALVNSWTGLGSLEGQMVKLNSDGTVVAFTSTAGVYVYEYTTSWVERPPHSSYQRFTVPGSSAYRIELSDDGDTLAVSYPSGTTAFFDEVAVFRWNATAYDLDYNQGSTTSIGSMSLNSTGTRLVLGYPNESDQIATTAIVSGDPQGLGDTFANPPPTLNGTLAIANKVYALTTGHQFQDNTMYWQINLGSSWTCSWVWKVYGPGWHGDDMRLIYFAPNPITASQASVHGGWNNYYKFSGVDTQQIRDNNDAYKKADFNMFYGHGNLGVKRMTVNYDNGVMTSTVHDYYGTLLSSISYDFGGAHQHLYGTPTYFGFSGKTGYYTSSQYIQNINLSGIENTGVIEVFDRAGPASWSQVGSDISGGKTNQKLGTVVKISGDGSTILNINEGRDGNDKKLSVFTLNSGTWTKNPINAVERTFDTGDGNDLADISDDGSFLVYAKGTGTELYATHPEGLASKYLDGFKLDGGVYRHVFQAPVPSASTNRVALAGNASRVLVLSGEEPSVFDVNETVFDPIITLNGSDGLDTLTVVGGAYTEQGATSNVTDGSSVTVGGDTVTATPGTYRVTYSVTDSNTGRSGFRSRVVIVT